MTRAKLKGMERINKGILRMLAFHARAFHLPHVRRYHAERNSRQKSYDRTNPVFGKPSRQWTLPLHLVDATRLNATDNAAERSMSWTKFLRWNYGMIAVADIRKNLVVASLATGKSAMVQYRIAERILSSKAGCEDFRIISVPLLHFRALVYVRRRKRQQKIVVPLLSPVVPLRLGTKYRADSVCNRLEEALEYRIQSALKGSRRSGVRKGFDASHGKTIRPKLEM
jgi:hypothetical protein